MPTVNPSFLRDIKNLDKRLGVKWNSNAENFIITFARPYGEPVPIHRVHDGGGGFKQPDNRDLAIIKGGDLAEGESMDSRLRKRAYAAERMREAEKKRTHDEIRDMTKDDRRYLTERITRLTNQGKGNSSVRRIKLKPSKNTVRTI